MRSLCNFNISLSLLHFLKHWLQFVWKLCYLWLQIWYMWVWIISQSRKHLMSNIMLSLYIPQIQIILTANSRSFPIILNNLRWLLDRFLSWFLGHFRSSRSFDWRWSRLLGDSWFNFAVLEEDWVVLKLVFLGYFTFWRFFFGWNHVEVRVLFDLFNFLLILVSFKSIWLLFQIFKSFLIKFILVYLSFVIFENALSSLFFRV